MYKISIEINGDWVEHTFEKIFQFKNSGTTGERIFGGIPSGDQQIFRNLVNAIQAPFYLLYILHTPRGEGLPGRYQSSLVSADQIDQFFTQFAEFLASDSRFDLWIHSPSDKSTLVWDRHNYLYAYGDISNLSRKLLDLGYVEGEMKAHLEHSHHYHSKFDGGAKAVLDWCQWNYSELKPEDRQFK